MFADEDPKDEEVTGAEEETPMENAPAEKSTAGKKEKQPDDWITMNVSSSEVKKAQAQSKAKADEGVKEAGGPGTAPVDTGAVKEKVAQAKAASDSSFAAAGAAKEAPPASYAASSPSTSTDKSDNLLGKIGIKDEKTQRIVLIGGGSVLFLCCACSCALTGYFMFFS